MWDTEYAICDMGASSCQLSPTMAVSEVQKQQGGEAGLSGSYQSTQHFSAVSELGGCLSDWRIGRSRRIVRGNARQWAGRQWLRVGECKGGRGSGFHTGQALKTEAWQVHLMLQRPCSSQSPRPCTGHQPSCNSRALNTTSNTPNPAHHHTMASEPPPPMDTPAHEAAPAAHHDAAGDVAQKPVKRSWR